MLSTERKVMTHEPQGLIGTENPTGGVYKWKTNHSGNVVEAKATLVAEGFSQTEGVDYFRHCFHNAPLPQLSEWSFILFYGPSAANTRFHKHSRQGRTWPMTRCLIEANIRPETSDTT